MVLKACVVERAACNEGLLARRRAGPTKLPSTSSSESLWLVLSRTGVVGLELKDKVGGGGSGSGSVGGGDSSA